MKAPWFWKKGGCPVTRFLLSPFGMLYGLITKYRMSRNAGWQSPRPVICIGNLVAGGAGKTPVVIEPLSKFPVKRDLCVDRSSQQKGMKKTLTWNHVDSFTLTKNPPVFRQNTNVSNPSNACLHCSACMEACPEYHVDSAYVGPMVLLQAFGRSKDSHGKLLAHKRKNVLQSKQGMSGCDHVQNCVKACPVELPISESIAKMKRQGMQNLLKQFLG